MNEKRFSLRKGMILVAFGVCLNSILQHLNVVADAWSYVWAVVSPIVLGLCLAFVLNVLMSACERLLTKAAEKTRIKCGKKLLRALALLMTFVIMLGAIGLTLVVIIPKISETLELFLSILPQSTAELSRLLGGFLETIGIDNTAVLDLQSNLKQLAEHTIDFLKDKGTDIAGYAFGAASSVFGVVTNIVFGLIIAVYVLLDKERISRFSKAFVRRFLPEKICNEVIRISKLSYDTFSNFVRGQFLEAVILGTLCFIGMVIFRFPYAAVVSLLIGVTALVPIVGAWIGCIISAFLVLLVSPIKALLLIVYILVLQQLEGNLIYPRVVGQSIGLPGVLVLSAVVIGQGAMGIAGALICVPVTAVIYAVLRELIYKNAPERPIPVENK